MRKNRFPSLAFLLLPVAISACSEIFSADIENETLTIFSPADSVFTSETSLSFWWEDNELVEQYQMEIATPDFADPTLVFDTLTVATDFEVEVEEEGLYTWRLRGKNEGSATVWTYRTFVVDLTTPYLPSNPNHHQDTIASNTVDVLSWSSSDAPIDGTQFAVGDSIYITRANDSTTVLSRHYLAPGASRSLALDVLNDLEGAGRYWWKVITVDRAGNRRAGNWFYFNVQ